jgi:hypothetical protein
LPNWRFGLSGASPYTFIRSYKKRSTFMKIHLAIGNRQLAMQCSAIPRFHCINCG